jgi:hypothetical protein
VRLVAEHVGMGLVSVCLSVRVFLYFPLRIIYQRFILSIDSFISDAMYCRQFAVPLNTPDSEETPCNTIFCPDDGGSSVLRSIAPYVSVLPPTLTHCSWLGYTNNTGSHMRPSFSLTADTLSFVTASQVYGCCLHLSQY